MALPVADSTFGVKKRIIYPGKGEFSGFRDGTKVTFHYQTKKCDKEQTLIDDSRKIKKPMELIMGKQFKFEPWEKCLKTMKKGEVASFTVEKNLTAIYPIVAKSLRDINAGKSGNSGHCCGMAMSQQGLGYPDLDQLLKEPETLEFIMEVLQIEEPEDYKKETWVMDEEEKVLAIPKLKEEGNEMYKERKYTEAATKYAEALGILDQLILREKPGDEEWKQLDVQKIPLLLNFSQCKLLEKDFYQVIEHTTDVLNRDPDNVKALFRRAKAHVGAWNPEDARQDFLRVKELDSSLAKSVQKELGILDSLQAEKHNQDKNKFQGKMFG